MTLRRLVPAVGFCLFCACGAPGMMAADAGACQASYSGNFVGSATSADACSTLSTAADGGPNVGTLLAVKLRAANNESVQLDVQINLGASPSTGDVTSENVHRWSAIGLAASNNCLYSAGSDSVPPGNFTLTLASVTGVAHGTLHVEQYVQAPPQVDCGPGDTETVDVTF